MVTAEHKTTDVKLIRAAFALSVTHNDGGGELVVEYRPGVYLAPEPAYHHDAISRALEVVAERGWNPTDCTFGVLRLVVGNGPDKHHWFEAVDFLSYPQALAVATGKVHYLAPGSLDDSPDEPLSQGAAEYRAANPPTTADGARRARAAEEAGPKTERDATPDLLASLFGVE